MGWISWLFILALPLGGLVYAGFTSYLKYRQHRAMLDVLKVYAERGEAPPPEVLSVLAQSSPDFEPPISLSVEVERDPDSARQMKVQGPLQYWSLVGLFAAMAAGFAYAAWASGTTGYPFVIVAFTMGAVGIWALVMAIGLTLKK